MPESLGLFQLLRHASEVATHHVQVLVKGTTTAIAKPSATDSMSR
jgi:hypothetical protein